ncbi:MAG: hemN [Burkholderiales bacterium]|jgi:oxygen-independent coproporphyrinogen-3 oxidase|nr:hemN [Burkholderiales bacterium]
MIDFDRELIAKCQTNAPRYTSYPTADRFNFEFTRREQEKQLSTVFTNTKSEPISLYIHIPFCNTLCLFCACNKIITNDRSQISKYLGYLEKEMELYYQLIGRKLDVIQLHFGGGSPSWLSIDEVSLVMSLVRKYFNLDTAKEIAMEIDPRHTDAGFISCLNDNGFNRISIGLQDLDPKVQKAVNRIQPYEQSELVLNSARSFGFKSTNIDLIYGLPFQNMAGFSHTLDQVLELAPDRIALFNYAHIPGIFMPQSRINEEDMPKASEKLDILQMSVNKLVDNGYIFIGMDHFAKANDELAVALKSGTLQRNFQGYSTFADTNMVSFGISSIGFIGNTYYQNVKDTASYYLSLDNNQLPILRGFVLNNDDILRRYIISQIMCQFKLDYLLVEQRFKINFTQYFAAELEKIKMLEEIGLLKTLQTGLEVSNKGRFLIRNIAVMFDKYYKLEPNKYSKVI